MKFAKTLALGVAAASVAGIAHAQTVVYVTGSTAFRAADTDAIYHIFDGGAPTSFADDKGGTGLTTSLEGCSHFLMAGNITIGGVSSAYVVKANWSGSAAGVETVSQAISIPFIATGSTGNQTSFPDNHAPELAFSDAQQVTTPFTSPKLKEDANSPVGVIPFYFVRNNGSSPSLTNMTPQLAQYLWGNGSIPLALFTGNNSDEGTVVYATGRNSDSGTRLIAFSETGVGALSDVVQYQITPSGANGSSSISSIAEWPVITVNGLVQPLGDGGESSGGTVQADMSNLANGFNFVAYLGESDAANLFNPANNGGSAALAMTYCGVPFSHTAIQEGQYTYWGYEHLYYPTGSSVSSFADKMGLEIKTVTFGDSGLSKASMNVSRGSDGGNVTANYF